jgi:two-component system chemotaxis response regulator CheB
MGRIRVLVVEDSLTVRKYLVNVLQSDPDLEVLAEAEDGKQATELCASLRPDAVSMDMMMPVMTGLEATEHIMAYCPTPILVVSASTNRGELFKTYDALSAGAVDVLEKPSGAETDQQWEQAYRRAIKMVSRIKVITHPRARLARRDVASREREIAAPRGGPYRCVAIGASTGGPGAVAQILRGLPADFPLPILLVIHIGAPFGRAMAEWLDTLSPLRVTTAVAGQMLPPVGQARVVLAPPDRHLVLRGNRLWTTADPERHFCRPSVDVLFESLAHELRHAAIACLLTGMGADGAAGLLAIRRAGGFTLVQDEETSVVFGMPREAIALGAATSILPLDKMAPYLISLACSQGARGDGSG